MVSHFQKLIPKRIPLRKKVSYPKAMTVCIAAACLQNGEPRIVLCSDTRVDYGELGSVNNGVKLDVLGYGWCVQMAGGWSNVCQWKEILKEQVCLNKAHSLEIMMKNIKTSGEKFIRSPLCESGCVHQLLVSGFLKNTPIIIQADVWPKKVKGHVLQVAMAESFSAIGSGYSVATSLLSARECHFSMPLEYVSYMAYEAKRSSEKTGGVGRVTVLLIHAPGRAYEPTKANFAFFSDIGRSHLEQLYETLWKVPVVELPAFTPEFFEQVGPLHLQSPTADQ